MEARLASLEGELSEVRAEVLTLRAEVCRLRQRLAQDEASRASDLGSVSSVLDSPLRSQVGSNSGYSLVTGAPASSLSQLGGVGQAPRLVSASPSAVPDPLTWGQREQICRAVGVWLRTCLEGRHRGASGRDRIAQASRCWLVARDYLGNDLGHLRLFRKFCLCRDLVKRGNSCGESVFIGVPSDREAVWVSEGADLPLVEP